MAKPMRTAPMAPPRLRNVGVIMSIIRPGEIFSVMTMKFNLPKAQVWCEIVQREHEKCADAEAQCGSHWAA